MSLTESNDKLLCYLSPKALEAIAWLSDHGLDRDLAIAVLEQLWPEAEIYDIPEDVAHEPERLII